MRHYWLHTIRPSTKFIAQSGSLNFIDLRLIYVTFELSYIVLM